MDINSRPVVVKRMPERLNSRTAREFLRDVRPFLAADRPQLVFDLSLVAQIDAAGVEMLLRCMSEAHKRDGDVKLASLSDQAAALADSCPMPCGNSFCTTNVPPNLSQPREHA